MYYNATFADYLDAQEGFNKQMELEQHLLRRHAYIIHASLVEKPAKPQDLWPIGEDEKRTAESDEQFKARMLRENDEIIKKFLERQSTVAQA